MTYRLYFVLPDTTSARQMADDLLLARVEDKRMHFLAKRGTDLGALHEASYLQKTDIVHGASVGMALGGAIGLAIGLLLLYFPPGGVQLQLVTVLISTVIGVVLGAWVSSMVAMQVPNSRLKIFEQAIDQGKVLLMLDLPMSRAEEIRTLVTQRHPEAASGGQEAMVPAFP
jgi:hypothetical protein